MELSTSLLGRADSPELFLRWHRDRDQRAREELIERFMPLARKLAMRYMGAHEPLEDLLQVASLGLIHAVDRFDPERGNAFTSFAVPTIVGELKRYFRDVGWSAHVPRKMHDAAIRVQAAEKRLTTGARRSPTVGELATYLEMSIEEVVEALEAAAAHHARSLDVPVGDDDGDRPSRVDMIGEADERFDLVEARLTLVAAARQLPLRDRRVLALRMVDGLTQRQIADLVGVSQMQVSRILRRASEHIRRLTDGEAAGTARRQRSAR